MTPKERQRLRDRVHELEVANKDLEQQRQAAETVLGHIKKMLQRQLDAKELVQQELDMAVAANREFKEQAESARGIAMRISTETANRLIVEKAVLQGEIDRLTKLDIDTASLRRRLRERHEERDQAVLELRTVKVARDALAKQARWLHLEFNRMRKAAGLEPVPWLVVSPEAAQQSQEATG